ncbi:fibronectin type III domain-containing protein [Sinirhodobacter populi]|uniref:Fibronectin type III domain-containing protein n=1 Tax=Paenirhodobacter populi TaxID=2306993 RepID=A0A443JXP6_9RHOB|nr:fibronectin type III domain-containing protein [Sinirhodobacter populi]RWR25293.1 fibronectin type III domain-containing protein [Sinirhodobacter populi]
MGLKDYDAVRYGSRRIIAAYRGETQVFGGAVPVPAVPGQIDAGLWSVATGDDPGEIVVSITGLPSTGGSAITGLVYRIGTGAAQALGAGIGTWPITGLTPGADASVQIAAVNAVGRGPWATVKSATAGAEDVVPATIALSVEPVSNRVYQRAGITGGAGNKGAASVSFSVNLSGASPVYARVRDADSDAVIVAATQVLASGAAGENIVAITVPARLGWNCVDVAVSPSGPWTPGANRFGVGRVILGVGQSQLGRTFSNQSPGAGTIAELVPAASPYAVVRGVYTGDGGFETATLTAGWQVPNDTTGNKYYSSSGAPELLRRQIAAHGVNCAFVAHGTSGGKIENVIAGGSRYTQVRNLVAETGAWEAFWFYMGGSDAAASTSEATFTTRLNSLMADLDGLNAYTGAVAEVFTATGTRYSNTIAQVRNVRKATKAVAESRGAVWFEPRNAALVDDVHPTQAGNVTLCAALHRAFAGEWVQANVVSVAASGSTITLTFNKAISVSGNPVGRVAVYPTGTTANAKTVSSVTASGSVLTITLSDALTASVDVWLYPHPDSAALLSQVIADTNGIPVRISLDPTVAAVDATAPAQFATGGWSVVTGAAANEITLTVTTLPSNGGSPITALQYTVDGGNTWTALSGTGTGSRTLTMPAPAASYTFALRAVNAVGPGPASAAKSATSGAASSALAATFGSEQITVTNFGPTIDPPSVTFGGEQITITA